MLKRLTRAEQPSGFISMHFVKMKLSEKPSFQPMNLFQTIFKNWLTYLSHRQEHYKQQYENIARRLIIFSSKASVKPVHKIEKDCAL
jgi:hypothetical protein